MNPRQILLILAARYKIALLFMLCTVAIALPIILYLPKEYTAATTLFVDMRSQDPISALFLPGNLATQEDIIRSDRVARKVVQLTKLDQNPAVRQEWLEATGGTGKLESWLADLLQRKLAVSPPRRDSNIITIEYTAADPGFAAAVANAFAQGYMDTAIELKVEPAKQYARWFGEQSKSLRENLEKAQARLSEYQQSRGIVARDESFDTETARLAALTNQLTVIQAETAGARSRQRSGGTADKLPEVMGNSVIAGLRSDIARQEARLKEVAGNLGPNHPQYQRMQSQLAELKSKLEVETRYVASSFAASRSVGSDTERALKAAIEAQKQKLLELRSQRDRMAVLQRDVDAARSAYEAVERRFTQVTLESQATQTNVFHLTPAEPPLTPSKPNVLKYILAAIAFGGVFGVGVAFGAEVLDRRVRCVDDLTEMLQLPVLVVMPKLLPARAGRFARLAFWRRPPALPPSVPAA